MIMSCTSQISAVLPKTHLTFQVLQTLPEMSTVFFQYPKSNWPWDVERDLERRLLQESSGVGKKKTKERSSSTVWKTKEAIVTKVAKCQAVDGWLNQVTVCEGPQARLWNVNQHALCNVGFTARGKVHVGVWTYVALSCLVLWFHFIKLYLYTTLLYFQ